LNGSTGVLVDACRCAGRVLVLLTRRRLHLRRGNVGASAQLPDRRRFVVFRETTCDRGDLEGSVTLAVWFHLRFVPAGGRLRRFVFERESILNTLLYAGFEGYRVKLWMVDPATSDYAGLYAWSTHESAERYASYITAVLRPLSVAGSVGYEIRTERLDAYLAKTGSAVRLDGSDPISPDSVVDEPLGHGGNAPLEAGAAFGDTNHPEGATELRGPAGQVGQASAADDVVGHAPAVVGDDQRDRVVVERDRDP
jgi:hypothetical protein